MTSQVTGSNIHCESGNILEMMQEIRSVSITRLWLRCPITTFSYMTSRLTNRSHNRVGQPQRESGYDVERS